MTIPSTRWGSLVSTEPKTLKLLHKLKSGDRFFLDVAGLPSVLQEPRARLVFLRYYRSGTNLRRIPSHRTMSSKWVRRSELIDDLSAP
jgi:hypothetical protein